MKMKRVLTMVLVLMLCVNIFSVAADTIVSETAPDTDSKNIISQSSDSSGKNIFIDTNKTVLKENDSVIYDFVAEQGGLYELIFGYTTDSSNSESIELQIKIDGQVPCAEASVVELDRYYSDVGGVQYDAQNNEIHATIEEQFGTYEYVLYDDNYADKCLIEISQGNHTIELNGLNGTVEINNIRFESPTKEILYDEYLSSKVSDYEGQQIVFEAEGECLFLKTDNKIVGMSDNTSANVNPSDYKHDKINFTGGQNWSQPGESISWKIKVPKSGYYSLAVNYKQSYSLNTTFYRQLTIDGKIPFAEAKNIIFPYARDWTIINLGDGKNEFKFYFEADKEYELKLTVTIGPLSDLCDKLENTTAEIAAFYRNIIMVTGDTIDSNRDYNLFNLVENWDERLNANINALEEISSEMKEITGSNGSSTISTINNLKYVLVQMRDKKYSAHKQIDSLNSYYASLCSLLGELRSMPLDIDSLVLTQPKSKVTDIHGNFLERIWFSFNKFLYSFVDDYSSVANAGEREKITIWVNWGQDQAKVLKYLSQSDFSVKHNIDVDIKITNATLTHAMLSGNGPDLMLNLSRSEPVNLAMRDALVDITVFDGTGEYKNLPNYEDVLKRFSNTASVPYWFERDGHRGLYALPDTQTFFMMFVREDIFNELGLEVPKSWEEFDNAAVTISRNNMLVGLPYTQVTTMEQVNVGAGALSIFPTLHLQKNQSLYTADYTTTDLLDKETIEVFSGWTNYYTKYGFPMTYDFFNRFRVGLMPMAIQPYTNYATLSAAAPEIDGLWQMYEVPGVLLENGEIDNRVSGGGTGAGILSTSKNKEAAWEFICWWTSAETQYNYCYEVESKLGPSARVATSNVDALKTFEWSGNNLETLLSQWGKVDEIPEVPGGYSVARIIDQAFWNTVNGGEDPQDMLIKWSKIADNIIERKREQYGLPVKGVK